MEYIHVRNLEKFHPGYKDRTLHWAKIYCTMVQGDPDCELITDEIDWGRLIKFILLELEARKPIPLDEKYLEKKGFNLKKRSIDKTLLMLHNFLDTVTEQEIDETRGTLKTATSLSCVKCETLENAHVTEEKKLCVVDKNKRRVREEKEKSKSRGDYVDFEQSTLTSWNSFCEQHPLLSKIESITETRRNHLKKRFEQETFKDFARILQKIKEQPFLINGNQHSKEHKGWKVSFDWLIGNDTNHVKVLEGKYRDEGGSGDYDALRERLGLKK